MRFVREQSLPLAMFAIFAVTLAGLAYTGWGAYNQGQADHGGRLIGLGQYLLSPAFGEAVFENWESEFLQMGSYVLFTAFLFSRGSAESNDPDLPVPEDGRKRRAGRRCGAGRPGLGVARFFHEHSLTIALFGIFAASFALHAVTGAGSYSDDLVAHGNGPVSVLEYVTSSRFWFESLQNWQSEFLSVGALIVLSIFLRERGSPESKPVAARNEVTGT